MISNSNVSVFLFYRTQTLFRRPNYDFDKGLSWWLSSRCLTNNVGCTILEPLNQLQFPYLICVLSHRYAMCSDLCNVRGCSGRNIKRTNTIPETVELCDVLDASKSACCISRNSVTSRLSSCASLCNISRTAVTSRLICSTSFCSKFRIPLTSRVTAPRSWSPSLCSKFRILLTSRMTSRLTTRLSCSTFRCCELSSVVAGWTFRSADCVT